MTKPVRFSQADIARARKAAESAGLRLTGYEVRPDGTIKLEFGEPAHDNDDWRSGTVYERQQ